jgi:hypothetical protein
VVAMTVRHSRQSRELSFVVVSVVAYASPRLPVEEEASVLAEMARVGEAQEVAASRCLVASSEDCCHSEVEEYLF